MIYNRMTLQQSLALSTLFQRSENTCLHKSSESYQISSWTNPPLFFFDKYRFWIAKVTSPPKNPVSSTALIPHRLISLRHPVATTQLALEYPQCLSVLFWLAFIITSLVTDPPFSSMHNSRDMKGEWGESRAWNSGCVRRSIILLTSWNIYRKADRTSEEKRKCMKSERDRRNKK